LNKAAASPKYAPGLTEAETRKGEEGREEGRDGGLEARSLLWWLVLRLLLLFLHLPMPPSCEGEEEEGEEGGGGGFCR